MSLINCSECNKEISTHAKTCPNCGCPASADNKTATNKASTDKKKEISYQAPKPKTIIRPVGIFLGLLLLGSGAYLLFEYIPQHDISNINVRNPMEIAKAVSQGNYIHPNDIDIYKIVAWVILFLGVLQVIFGGTRKINITLYCKHCDFQVGINKHFSGNFCERCNAKLNKGNFIITIIGFFVLVIIFYYLFTSLFGLHN